MNTTLEDLAEAVAAETLSGLIAANEENRRFLIGVPAGRTLVPVFEVIEKELRARPIALDRLTIVMMDDYVLANGHGGWAAPPSTAHFSCRRFGEKLRTGLNSAVAGMPGIPESQLWSPDPVDPSAYDRRIFEAGGIDLFFVAVGASDCHVAFNPPGTAVDSRTRIIPLATTTRTDNLKTFPEFTSLEQVPTHGITVGIATLADARRLLMLAHGTSKGPAVKRLIEAGAFDSQWPATFIYDHPNASIQIDAAADSGLRIPQPV
ncbi:6-phosphogluconolactonase [Cryobacterium sp. TMT2-4]|uniref:6-phosphogluconolactonase n=1 Tax=Cryobacterium sp. TMT2-4 TaxID=1259254 RepID=UPI00141B3692|nr:6-phosphogluconolactonase [Cryobacterium sp. TMT2-4]